MKAMSSMRLNRYTWYRFEMKNLTMDQKRERIMKDIDIILNNAKENGYEYASLERLKMSICYTMDWVCEVRSIEGRHGMISHVDADTNNPKVAKTIENMVSKGIIKISKSGNGFTR